MSMKFLRDTETLPPLTSLKPPPTAECCFAPVAQKASSKTAYFNDALRPRRIGRELLMIAFADSLLTSKHPWAPNL